MNQKVSKMLRNTSRSTKKHKRWFKSLNQHERAKVRQEYMALRKKGNELV